MKKYSNNKNLNSKVWNIFDKRIFISFIILFTTFTVLIIRLFSLQITNNKKYSLLSDKNRIYTTYRVAPRGTIYDRNGKTIAMSQTGYQVVIDLSQYKNSNENWTVLSKILNLDKDTPFPTYIRQQLKFSGNVHNVLIKDNLNWQEILDCESLSFQIPGISVIPKVVRNYQYTEECCHVVGYVTPPTAKDVERNANLKVLGAVVGKMGIEQSFDEVLQGTMGVKQAEINASMHMVRIIEQTLPQKGKDIYLTIDVDLQKKVLQIMKPLKRGAAIVLDMKSGEILACVSVPTFDTNMFINRISQDKWEKLIKDEDNPMLNRCVAGLYPPGSTFKMVVAIAALNEQVITSSSTFFCNGHYDLGDRRFHCWKWKYGGHGNVGVIEALAQSCDVFFYNTVRKLGVSNILTTAKNFGFGERFNVGLLSEKETTLPSQTIFQRQFGQAINLSIGQGRLLANPLQLVTMTARLASGLKVIPRLVRKIDGGGNIDGEEDKGGAGVEGEPWQQNKTLAKSETKLVDKAGIEGEDARPEKMEALLKLSKTAKVDRMDENASDEMNFTPLPYDANVLKNVLIGMRDVVCSRLGTANNITNKLISGKTGSSQVAQITREERTKKTIAERPYHLRDHAIFVGFLNRFAVAVVVEHGESGSRTAAPIAEAILNEANKGK